MEICLNLILGRITLSNEENYIKILLNAIRIFSPSGKESEMAEFLLNFLKEHNFKNPQIDEAGNVIGEIGNGQPVLLISSHIDTINDFIEVKEDSEKIYGRGAVDAKGPLMSLAIAASKFCNKKINGKIIFAGIVNEETSVEGINTFLKNHTNINFAIFSEPNNLTNVVVAYKGRSLIEINIISKKGTGHPANSWMFDNSIEIAYNYYLIIKKLCNDKYRGKTPYFSVIPTITEFISQEGKNVIPSKASFYIDLRYPPGIDFNKLMEDLEMVKGEYSKDLDCIIEQKILSNVYPYSLDTKNKLVKVLIESIEETLSIKGKLTRKTGTTFMNVIGNKLKIPTVSIGPGNPTLEHSKEEYILKKDFLNSIKIMERFIEKFLGFKN